MSYHSYNIGDIADVGASPYQVSGDPVIAMIAQLNRFAGRSVNLGGACGTRNYLPAGALPLVSALNDHVASIANIIMYDRLNCIADASMVDFKKLATVRNGLANPIPWAQANLADITVQIAQFADSLDLPVASVGITKRDPKFASTFPTTTVVLLGAAVLAAVVMYRRK